MNINRRINSQNKITKSIQNISNTIAHYISLYVRLKNCLIENWDPILSCPNLRSVREKNFVRWNWNNKWSSTVIMDVLNLQGLEFSKLGGTPGMDGTPRSIDGIPPWARCHLFVERGHVARDLFTVSIIFGEICASHQPCANKPWPIVIYKAR